MASQLIVSLKCLYLENLLIYKTKITGLENSGLDSIGSFTIDRDYFDVTKSSSQNRKRYFS